MPARHTRPMKVAGASLLLCSALATVGVAEAATSHHKRHHTRRSSTSTSSSSSRSSSSMPGPPSDETELSGETATKAREAALAAVPGGTVLRASTESPSDPSKAAYEVHVRRSGSSVVEVLLDSSYKVLAVKSAPAHVGGCPGRPPGAGAGAPGGPPGPAAGAPGGPPGPAAAAPGGPPGAGAGAGPSGSSLTGPPPAGSSA